MNLKKNKCSFWFGDHRRIVDGVKKTAFKKYSNTKDGWLRMVKVNIDF